MRVGFFITELKDDLRIKNIGEPNPGVGGTQFMFLVTSAYLSQRFVDLDVYVFSYKTIDIGGSVTNVIVNSFEECLKECTRSKIDYLVIRGPYISKDAFSLLKMYRCKTIVWSHNFENYSSIKLMEKCPYIVKNVCVSREQYERLFDTELMKKSCYIYNGLDYSHYKCVEQKDLLSVCYIGNLLPGSGYEYVLKSWPKVLKVYPNAVLKIIGGRSLYSENVIQANCSPKRLNRIRNLERKVVSCPSAKSKVVFTGVLGGDEKISAMATASVGIANVTPTGETFGIGAVEFQGLGVPVVSLNKCGLRDTVVNGRTGFLADSPNLLHTKIIEALSEGRSADMSKNAQLFVRENFNIETIGEEWHKLLLDPVSYCNNDNCLRERWSYEDKHFIRFNGAIRKVLPFLPNHFFYKSIVASFKKVIALVFGL